MIAAGVLVLAAGIAAGAYELSKSRSAVLAVPNSVAVIDAATNRVRGYTTVGNTPTAVTVGAGSVWALNSADETISRIDLATGKFQRNIPAVTSASNIAYARGAVWVAGSSNVLTRIAADVPQSTRTQGLPGTANPLVGGESSWVAGDTRMVWATSTAAVWRILPAPKRRYLSVGSGCCGPIALGRGSAWIVGDLGLIRVDAESGRQTLIKLPFRASAIAVAGQSVWVSDPLTNQAWRIDSNRNAVTGTTFVGNQPTGIAVGAGSIWVASADGTVSRIDPKTNRVVKTISVGGTPAGIVVGRGAVWVTVD